MRRLRREKIEGELAAAEEDFRTKLVAALTKCASGTWGLFGQNDHIEELGVMIEKAQEWSGAKALIALGEEIQEFRERLGIAEPFEPFVRLLELRGRKTENDLGEPRLAQAWLKELGQ